MDEDPEDLSSLHFQILFPPHEAGHRQREYELEQHLALMDEPSRAPAPGRMTVGMGGVDDGLALDQLTGFGDHGCHGPDGFDPMGEDPYPEEDVLDIGIEANDLGSLLQQFEQTEAAMAQPDSMEDREASKVKSKSKEQPVLDPKHVAKKITPVKRKTTILLEPLALPSKRLRAKDLLTAERACVSLPGSRASSPVAVQPSGLSVVCTADQGFDYLVMDHDYCTSSVVEDKPPASAAPVSVAAAVAPGHLTAEERKAVYKQKYKVRKRAAKRAGGLPGQQPLVPAGEKVVEQVPLINKLPEYLHPMPQVVLPPKLGPKQKVARQEEQQQQEETEIREAVAVKTEEEEETTAERPPFFDKIPDYFLVNHMYQRISTAEKEEGGEEAGQDGQKEAEPAGETLQIKEEEPQGVLDEAVSKKESHLKKQRRRSHKRRRSRRRRGRNNSSIIPAKDPATAEVSPAGAAPLVSMPSDKNAAEVRRVEQNGLPDPGRTERDRLPSDRPAAVLEEISNGRSRAVRRQRRESDCCSSRSSSRSSSARRHRRYSSSSSASSWSSSSRSSYDSRSRGRHASRDSYSSRSPSPRPSRSRSPSRSYRRRSRRYSTYSSTPRSSSSSRSRSRSRSRRWRPRSRSRSGSRSRSRSRGSRSRSSYSRRSRSRDKDWRSRRNSTSRTRERMTSQERQEQEEQRQKRLKEQQEQWTDRRVVYVGRIPYGTTRDIIRRRFVKFGEIERITLHFRDVGDNYAFVTFQYKCDAYAAVEGANKDKEEPEYDICFGGRRQFCKSHYEDLDSMGSEEVALEYGYSPQPQGQQEPPPAETDFDRLLREAMKKTKR